ncbi:disulfide bond formation protein DsbA [Pseudomonas sp. RW407]|uniref:DsbA family protein n=1 Tax=Pseudomonas sp. RW407 TaxID=2202894 RepID=UPI000D6F6AA1|nr:DsbA family protein [Pseudomonas sp. RW407]PWU28668.1 disulfide bond formation protein DsbA [Pseudomonas sp. RW407]
MSSIISSWRTAMTPKRLSALLVLLLIAGTGVWWPWSSPPANGPWLYGSPTARWTITEYADLECPYCRTYTPQLKRWVSHQQDVNLRWHHFPLQIHGAAAVHEARLVHCAGSLGGAAAFWSAVDQVLARTGSNGQGIPNGFVVQGLDNGNSKVNLELCANSNEIALLIEQERFDAQQKGIQATPTLEITDNRTGRSVRLEGPADSTILLSAMDSLANHQEALPGTSTR